MGIKAGVRNDRVGFFAKFRPGVTSDSKVLHFAERREGFPSQTTYRRSTVAAFDLGGVVEWYVVRGLLLRFDAGTVAYSPKADFTLNGQLIRETGPGNEFLQFAFGAGWRF